MGDQEGFKTIEEVLKERELRKKCPWLECAHGMGVAAFGLCYVKGNPDDPLCVEFISDREWERQNESRCENVR